MQVWLKQSLVDLAVVTLGHDLCHLLLTSPHKHSFNCHHVLQVWLKQPLVDLAEITTRHDIVEAFTSDPMLRESLRDQHLRGTHQPQSIHNQSGQCLALSMSKRHHVAALHPANVKTHMVCKSNFRNTVSAGMPDVERLTRKLERRKCSLSDLCQLYRASSKLPLIQTALLEHPGTHASLLQSRSAFTSLSPTPTLLTTVLITPMLHFAVNKGSVQLRGTLQ